jgi:phospholipid-transporting ATPase
MMNDTTGVVNISNIESKLNTLILGILVFECLCCAFSSIMSYVLCNSNRNFIDYLGQDYSCSTKAGIAFGSYFILYNTFIPISLIVSL